jgi:hypothetical protein
MITHNVVTTTFAQDVKSLVPILNKRRSSTKETLINEISNSSCHSS